MRNMAVTTFMALGLMAAAALAQQQPGRTGPSSPSSSQPANPNSTGSRSGPRTRPSDSQSSTRNSTASPVTFDEADKNQDGKLTKKEAKKVHDLSFSSADTDKNAALSREEFQIAMGSAARPRG